MNEGARKLVSPVSQADAHLVRSPLQQWCLRDCVSQFSEFIMVKMIFTKYVIIFQTSQFPDWTWYVSAQVLR